MKQDSVWSLQKRLIILILSLVTLSAVSVGYYYSLYTQRILEKRLMEKVDFLKTFYAASMTQALASEDDVRLLEDVQRLEQDPEITSVIITDENRAIRYHPDSQKIGSILDDPVMKRVLENREPEVTLSKDSGGASIIIHSPLLVRNRPTPIGGVRMDVTHRFITEQMINVRRNYFVFVLGLLATCYGIARYHVHKWVSRPLNLLARVVAALHPLTMESNLPEPKDEIGTVYKSLNELIQKVRLEIQRQSAQTLDTENREKQLLGGLLEALSAKERLLVADRENRLILDTGPEAIPCVDRPHLLDIITEPDLAQLVGAALQKDGEITRGQAQFRGHNYEACVLRLDASTKMSVRTLIVLKQK